MKGPDHNGPKRAMFAPRKEEPMDDKALQEAVIEELECVESCAFARAIRTCEA
jgi:hypothetical protein